MYLDDLIHSPADRIAAFAQKQVHLYRHDTALQDYFFPLQLDRLTTSRVSTAELRPANRLSDLALRVADNVSRFPTRQKIKTDVLFCPIPYFERKTENQFLQRTLLGLAQTDAKIVCLLPATAPCRGELESQLATIGRGGQVTFLDPGASLNWMEARLRSRVARRRGHSAFEQTVQILEPHGLGVGEDVKAWFEHAAYFVEAWERLEGSIDFEAVVARCHWHVLCAPVCRTALKRGKSVITFQQGVIGHTLDVPVTASKYVAFGQASASFLARLNAQFFEMAAMPSPPAEYVSAGSLFDTLTELPNQFDNQTLLMVDTHVSEGDFYGIEGQCQALLELADKLLTAALPLRRLVIRPHPYWSSLDLEACQQLVREHSDRCELSHPVWSLEDDLRRSSVVVGIFSGVLTVASACGLPTIFLETKNGYKTGDLACFGPHQTLQPDTALSEIRKILTNRQAYEEARTQALRNAREYYADGRNVDLGAAFFERLLCAKPVSTQPQHELKRQSVVAK